MQTQLHHLARVTLIGIVIGLLAMLPAQASDNAPRPLLAAVYGELCTTCDAYLLCESTTSLHAHARLLHVHKHSFWGQIGTIWTWLRHLFQPVRPDSRHLTVYQPTADGRWAVESEARVTLDLRSLRIEFPTGWIDRNDGGWHDHADQRIGVCRPVGPAVLSGEAP